MVLKYAAENTTLMYMVLKSHKMVKFGLRIMLNRSQHCSKTKDCSLSPHLCEP